jgi:hypothetical protein
MGHDESEFWMSRAKEWGTWLWVGEAFWQKQWRERDMGHSGNDFWKRGVQTETCRIPHAANSFSRAETGRRVMNSSNVRFFFFFFRNRPGRDIRTFGTCFGNKREEVCWWKIASGGRGFYICMCFVRVLVEESEAHIESLCGVFFFRTPRKGTSSRHRVVFGQSCEK